MPKLATTLLCLCLSVLPLAGRGDNTIYVNGVALTQQEIVSYQIQVPAGRYWYDAVSGLWGQEGGPNLGQMVPGLDLGGALKADASGKGSGVFINGREIHAIEVLQLMEYFGGPIQAGRYWLQADGVGGVEGQAASFTLNPQQTGGESGGKVFEDEVADFCAEVGGCPW